MNVERKTCDKSFIPGTYMSQKKNGRRAWRRVSSALVAPSLVLLVACGSDGDDPSPTAPTGQAYLDEIFQVEVENGIQYGSALDENGAEEALRLDLFRPTDDDQGLRPAVVWLHGGSFQQGGKGQVTEFSRRFSQRGYVAAAVNYRLRENDVFDYTNPDDELAQQVKLDAQHDVQAAVRWLRANADAYSIDADRIFVVGYSAGGTTALRVASSPDDPGTSGNPDYSSSVKAAVAIAAYPENGTLESIEGRTLLIHGENDAKVPLEMVEEACSSVSRCQLVPVPDAGHSMLQPAKEPIITETAAFLRDEVVGA